MRGGLFWRQSWDSDFVGLFSGKEDPLTAGWRGSVGGRKSADGLVSEGQARREVKLAIVAMIVND